jgi:hypothetical protein
MAGQAIALKVIASVPVDCRFWMEDDGWNGQCEKFLIHVRAPHFEEIKRRMESALEAQITSLLDQMLQSKALKQETTSPNIDEERIA